jgi:hypothetical protein
MNTDPAIEKAVECYKSRRNGAIKGSVRSGILRDESWQRSSDYHVGHYHTIMQRRKDLKEQIAKLERRGNALQLQISLHNKYFVERKDFLIVASPEYLAPDRPSLWYNEQPRVITVDELVHFVNKT